MTKLVARIAPNYNNISAKLKYCYPSDRQRIISQIPRLQKLGELALSDLEIQMLIVFVIIYNENNNPVVEGSSLYRCYFVDFLYDWVFLKGNHFDPSSGATFDSEQLLSIERRNCASKTQIIKYVASSWDELRNGNFQAVEITSVGVPSPSITLVEGELIRLKMITKPGKSEEDIVSKVVVVGGHDKPFLLAVELPIETYQKSYAIDICSLLQIYRGKYHA